MKFSYSLQFNAVPEWTEDYLSYGEMKKAIHELETCKLEEAKGLSTGVSAPPTGAGVIELGSQSSRLESEFERLFEEDARRVSRAFSAKKEACHDKLRGLFSAVTSDSSSDVAVNRIEVWTGDEGSLEKRRATLEDRFNTVYLNLHDLHDFLDLNYTGYVKTVKNYGKYVNGSGEQRRALLAKVDAILPIGELSELQHKMGEVEEVFGRVMCDGSVTQARATLHLLLRDRVAAHRQSLSSSPASSEIMKTAPILPTSVGTKTASTHAPVRYFTPYRIGSLIGTALIFFLVLALPQSYFGPLGETLESKRCLAILLSCTVLWCTEAIPLYATAMLVPALVSVLRVIKREHLESLMKNKTDEVTAALTTKFIFPAMFSCMIFLLIGGFSIAAAFQKYGITHSVAVVLLKRFGKTPSSVLLTIMAVTTIASALVSNVAAPVLCFGLIQPIIRNLDYNHPLARSLILGIAFAANIGGLGSPIASPQSIIGCKELNKQVGFPEWLPITTPIAIVSTVFCWLWLRFTFPCDPRESLNFKEIFAAKAVDRAHSPVKIIAVLAISAITLVLWVFATPTEDFTGSMGTLAVIPIVGLFGSGLLGKEDFNGFMWNVVMLALGGSALGKALDKSGLLNAIGEAITVLLKGYSFFTVLCIFCAVLLFITTFISHSVGAMVFLPVIKAFAMKSVMFESNYAQQAALILAGCLTCSAGMAMPISGFPNMTAAAQQDRNGRPYVSTREFAIGGVIPSIVFAMAIVGSVSTIGLFVLRNFKPFPVDS